MIIAISGIRDIHNTKIMCPKCNSDELEFKLHGHYWGKDGDYNKSTYKCRKCHNYVTIDSRNTKNSDKIIRKFLSTLFERDKDKIDFIITGGARGTDMIAKEIAKDFNILTKTIRPKDPKIKQDYILRNFLIVDQADKVYTFWDGKSKGTKSVIDYAKKTNKYLCVIEV